MSFAIGRSTVLAAVCAALLSSLQFGGYSILSVNFVLFAVIVLVVGPRRYYAVVPVLLACWPLMFVGYAWYLKDDDLSSALFRTIREFVVLATVLAACKRPIRWTARLELVAKKAIIMWVAACVSLALVQFMMIELSGTGPFLPWQLYGATGGTGEGGTTVPSFWLQFAAQHGLEVGTGRDVYVRPVAFYSEPSYLGFLLVAAWFCYAKIETDTRKTMLCFGAVLVGVLVARTAAGIFALLVLFTYMNFRKFRSREIRPYLVIGFLVSIGAAVAFVNRIYGAFDATDASSYSRIVMPILALGEVMGAMRLMGVPSFYVPEFLGFHAGVDLTGAYGADNGLVNLLIFYGFGGLIIISMLLKTLKSNWILFVMCAMFNGSVLHFDKGLVLAVVLLIASSKACDPSVHHKREST